MCDHTMQNWKELHTKLDRVRGLSEPCRELINRLLSNIESSSITMQHPQPAARLWRWLDKAADKLQEFALPNKRVYLFLLPQDFTHSRLNAIWEADLDKGKWRTFWHSLWTSDLTTKGNVFLWIFSGGFSHKDSSSVLVH
jgi:hypothetical protein